MSKKIAVYLSKEDLETLYTNWYGFMCREGQNEVLDDSLAQRLQENLETFEEGAEDNTELNALVQSYCEDIGVETDPQVKFMDNWNKALRGKK